MLLYLLLGVGLTLKTAHTHWSVIMQPVQPASRPDGRRAWLAAFVLQQPDRFPPRLAVGLARLRALPRGYRRRLQRYVALTRPARPSCWRWPAVPC